MAVRVATSSLLVGLVLALGGCGGSQESELADLVSGGDRRNADLAYSMAADAVQDMNLDAGTVVVVPTDRALLAQDADALAELAAEGSLEETLRRLIVRNGYDPERMTEAILITEDAIVLQMKETDGDLFLGQTPYVGIESIDGVELIIVDGMVGTK